MQKQLPRNRLAELRNARGEKLWELCAIVQRDSTTIWRWEAGKSAIPHDVLRILAEHYGVTAEHLLGWDRDSKAAA